MKQIIFILILIPVLVKYSYGQSIHNELDSLKSLMLRDDLSVSQCDLLFSHKKVDSLTMVYARSSMLYKQSNILYMKDFWFNGFVRDLWAILDVDNSRVYVFQYLDQIRTIYVFNSKLEFIGVIRGHGGRLSLVNYVVNREAKLYKKVFLDNIIYLRGANIEQFLKWLRVIDIYVLNLEVDEPSKGKMFEFPQFIDKN